MVLTRGHASMARHRVNARLDGELSTEEFGRARMIAFPLIWAALVIYSAAMLRQSRRPRTAPEAA